MTTDISVLTGLVQSNSYIHVPPDIYLISSSAPSPYPNVVGMCGGIIQNKHDFVLDCTGSVITKTDSLDGNCPNWLMFDKCSNFKVQGLTIRANSAGMTSGSYAGCLMLVHLDRFEFSDIRIVGQQWCVGVSGIWLTHGRFDRVWMDSIYEGWDLAFLQHVTFRDCVGWGIAQLGPLSGNASPWGWLNIAPDFTFVSRYPDEPGPRTTGCVVVENCAAFNFAAAVAIRSGVQYRILGNDFSFNTIPASVILAHGGAGIVLWSYPDWPCQSATDPIQNVLISGNLFNSDGDAAVVLDASAVGTAPISRVSVKGNWCNSPKLVDAYGGNNIVSLVTDLP